MKTLSFRLIVGVEKGYFHNLRGVAENGLVYKVSELWQKMAREEYNKSYIYVSAVVQPGAVVYNQEWGCPTGGESIVVLSGSANPTFIKDLDSWKETVVKLSKELKKELKQNTLTIEFQETDLVYLTD